MKHLLLCVGILLLPLLAWAADKPVTARGDLDGDGASEQITVTVNTKQPSFTLRVADQTLTERVPPAMPGEDVHCSEVQVVDINTHDRYKEVLVTTQEYPCHHQWLYWYDRAGLHRMGSYNDDLKFTGYGIVYQGQDMHFWYRIDKYVLDAKTHALSLVPQPFYYVGTDATVTKSIPIYEAQSKDKIVAHLLPKSEITILLNKGDWYLIKTSTDLTGWIPEKMVTADNFEDLPYGD